jgi:hypothetical protein
MKFGKFFYDFFFALEGVSLWHILLKNLQLPNFKLDLYIYYQNSALDPFFKGKNVYFFRTTKNCLFLLKIYQVSLSTCVFTTKLSRRKMLLRNPT